MPDITLGDYEIDDDSNGDLVIRDPGDTIVFRWDETNSQWNLEQQDITNLNSLETEQINNNWVYIDQTSHADITAINNELTTSGNTYIINDDYTSLSDRIEAGADNITIIVNGNLKIADGASPTLASLTRGDTTATIIVKDQDGVDVVVRDEIDANDTNHTRGTGIVYWGNSAALSGGRITFDREPGNITDANDAVFVEDADELETDGVYSTGASAAVLALEDTDKAQLRNTTGDGTGEVIDLNRNNTEIEISGVAGYNCTEEIVDVDDADGLTISNVTSRGSNQIIVFGAAAAVSNVEVHGVEGDSTGDCIGFTGDQPIDDVDITGINCEATASDSSVIGVYPDSTTYSNITLRGQGRATNSASDHGIKMAPANGGTIDGVQLDFRITSNDKDGLHMANDINEVTGTVVAYDCGDDGVELEGDEHDLTIVANGNSSSGVMAKFQEPVDSTIRITANNNGAYGVRMRGVRTRYTGSVHGNTTADVNMNADSDSCTVDVTYDSISNIDKGTRNSVNGNGFNSGDPTSTGDWNGNAKEAGTRGLIIHNTSNDPEDAYIADKDGSWMQIGT